MNRAEGGNLEDLVVMCQRTLIDEVRVYFKQIVEALSFLHVNDIIHRDLKPSNIVLDKDLMLVKLCDFGSSKSLVDDDLASTYCGTPDYMGLLLFTVNFTYYRLFSLYEIC